MHGGAGTVAFLPAFARMPSTSIRRFAYDPASRTLSVWFVASGRRYDYVDVPPAIAGGLRRAFSKGRYFNAMIRDRYDFKRVA